MSKPEFSPENAIKTSGLERVLNIVPSAIIAVDKDQRICFFNQRAEDTFGYDAADVLDRPLQMLLPSGAHTRHGSLFETFAASTDVSREIPVTPDMRGKRKNGQEFPFSSTICRLEIDSEQFFSAVLHDVDSPRETELALRRSERRFQTFANSTPMGLLITRQTDGEILFANNRAEDILGLPTDHMLGQDSLQFFTQPEKRLEWVEDLGTGTQVSDQVMQMRTTQGDLISASNFVQTAVFDGEKAILTAFEDISGRLALEEKLRQAQKMEAVGQLAGGLAHDFNNLLSVIMSNLSYTLDENAGENSGESGIKDHETRDLIASALSAAERGARLTERLMAFSRQQPVTQQRLDLSIVVRNFKELLARSLEQNITLQTDLATGLWLCETDISLIESALLNLVLNGRDAIASKAGSGKITITTRNLGLQQDHIIGTETVALGSYVVLTVSDTGIGMAKAVADKALEPFFTTKRIGRGSGLGLSTVHSTIKQAGGHLTVESERGIGTAITIYLPKAQLLQITDPGYSDTAKDENAVGKIVLLVEDDPGVRKTLAMMLKRLGHTVREAGSSAAALQQVESDPQIDILVSDIRLSNGMNGYQLGKECRRLIPNLLTLYIPGLVSDPIASADGLGAREQQLIKPFQTTQLAEMLARLLEQD